MTMDRRTALKGGIVLALTSHTPAVAKLATPAIIIPTLEERIAFHHRALHAAVSEAFPIYISSRDYANGVFLIATEGCPPQWKDRTSEREKRS